MSQMGNNSINCQSGTGCIIEFIELFLSPMELFSEFTENYNFIVLRIHGRRVWDLYIHWYIHGPNLHDWCLILLGHLGDKMKLITKYKATVTEGWELIKVVVSDTSTGTAKITELLFFVNKYGSPPFTILIIRLRFIAKKLLKPRLKS